MRLKEAETRFAKVRPRGKIFSEEHKQRKVSKLDSLRLDQEAKMIRRKRKEITREKDGQIDGQIDEQVDGQTEKQTDRDR